MTATMSAPAVVPSPLTREMLDAIERRHSEAGWSVWSAATSITSDGTTVMPLNSGTIGLVNVREDRREAVAVLMQRQMAGESRDEPEEAAEGIEVPKYVDQPSWARRDSTGSCVSLEDVATSRKLSVKMQRRRSSLGSGATSEMLATFGEDDEEDDELGSDDEALDQMGVMRRCSSKTEHSAASWGYCSQASSRRGSARRRSGESSYSAGGSSWRTDSWWSTPYGLLHPPQADQMSEFSIPNTDDSCLYQRGFEASFHRPFDHLLDVDEEAGGEDESEDARGSAAGTPLASGTLAPAIFVRPQADEVSLAPAPVAPAFSRPMLHPSLPLRPLLPLGNLVVSGDDVGARGLASPARSHVTWGSECGGEGLEQPTSERPADDASSAVAGPGSTPREEEERTPTTLMLQHIPKSYSRDDLCDLLDREGLARKYDFVYLPVKFATGLSFGYAFVNFVSEASAKMCVEIFEGFSRWRDASDEVCSVSTKTTYQGQDECVQLYRNSPVMHESVDDNAKPAIFQDGLRAPFPGPTKKIKPPRARAPNAPGESPKSRSAA